MTDDPNLGPDMTAAELALGLLDGEDRAAALRRVLAEPRFAREVEDWRHRIAGLFDDYAEAPAPEGIVARIAAANDPARPRTAWPVLALATALAAAVALFFVTRPGPAPLPVPGLTPSHTMMAASLMMTDKSASVPAMVDMTTGEVRIPHADMAPTGKSAQLWMIGDDGVPQPMGVLAAQGISRVMLAADQRRHLAAGMTLAVSVEPIGGSPTGKPTGPVVATGKLSLA